MSTETNDEFMQRVLLAAHERGFIMHEEKRGRLCVAPKLTDGSPGETEDTRFTFILPDGRLISVAQWHGRRVALWRACRAVEPWIDKFEALTSRLNK